MKWLFLYQSNALQYLKHFRSPSTPLRVSMTMLCSLRSCCSSFVFVAMLRCSCYVLVVPYFLIHKYLVWPLYVIHTMYQKKKNRYPNVVDPQKRIFCCRRFSCACVKSKDFASIQRKNQQTTCDKCVTKRRKTNNLWRTNKEETNKQPVASYWILQ